MKTQILYASLFSIFAGGAVAEDVQPTFETFADVEAHAKSLGLAWQKKRVISECTFLDNVPVEIEDFKVYFDDDGRVAINCFAPVRPKLRPSPTN